MSEKCSKPLPDPCDEREPVNRCVCSSCAPTSPAVSEERVRKCAFSMTADPPQDCNAPFCGCVPAWTQALTMLEECGYVGPEQVRALTTERDALRAMVASADARANEYANMVVAKNEEMLRMRGGPLCTVDQLQAALSAERARLRVAVEALSEITELEQDSSTPDTFDCAAEALAAIGPLPDEPK